MAKVYRAAVIGTSRMGAFIDNEIPLVEVSPLARRSGCTVLYLGTNVPTSPHPACGAVAGAFPVRVSVIVGVARGVASTRSLKGDVYMSPNKGGRVAYAKSRLPRAKSRIR